MTLSTINQGYLHYLDQRLREQPIQERLLAALPEGLWRWKLTRYGISTPFRNLRTEQRIGQNGVPVWTTLIQANSALFRPGVASRFCLVLLTFDPTLGADEAAMGALAARIYEAKETKSPNPDLQRVSDIVTHERAYHYRRQKLPLSFTGGPVAYAADLFIERSRLQMNYLTGRRLFCLAEPGDVGGIELVPWLLAQHADNTPANA